MEQFSHVNLFNRKNPEQNAQAMEAQGAEPFDIIVNQVPESAIQLL